MKKYKWYGFTFKDNTYIVARGFSAQEMKNAVKKHGKLLSKEYLYMA